MDLRDSKRMGEWSRFCDQFNGPMSSEQNKGLYHCGGGIKSFSIDPSGKMGICLLLEQDRFDLREGSFKDGWENTLLKERQENNKQHTKCTACEIKAMCGMCPANATLENRDPEAPVDFLCQVAHLRAYALGFPVPPHGACEYCEGGIRHDHMMQWVAILQAGRLERNVDLVPGNTWPGTIQHDMAMPANTGQR